MMKMIIISVFVIVLIIITIIVKKKYGTMKQSNLNIIWVCM